MERKLVQRDQALDDQERKKSKKLRKMQLALKKQREKEKFLLEQKQKEEEEKLFYEKQYKDRNEEFEEHKKVLKEIRERYKGALQEIKDLEEEHEKEHAQLIDTIRQQEHELKLYKGMLGMMLKDNEIEKVRRKCMFDDEKQEWEIPVFILKAKEVQFPRLSANKARDMIESEKNSREVEFERQVDKEESYDMMDMRGLRASGSQPLLKGAISSDAKFDK